MPPARLPDSMERRAAAELHIAGRRLAGYAATFDTPARIGDFTETIKPGAFRASLADQERDCLMLVDHDPGRLLGRTSSGTLRLREDGRGLAFDLDLPDTQLGRDVLTLVQRGDVGGCSFGFRPTDEAWPAPGQRELRAVDLLEISCVHAWPAYGETTISARSRRAARPGASVARLRLWLAAQ